MVDELPPASELDEVFSRLHENTVSPNGKFGFQMTTSQTTGLPNTWFDTWEEFFTTTFLGVVRLEQSIQGRSDELQQLTDETWAKVIPRLLRPMETNGRSVKPVLVHGDLWHGNTAVEINTGKTILFYCARFYGHDECECSPFLKVEGPRIDIEPVDLGMWRAIRYQTNTSHVRAYRRKTEPSPPVEEFDDRNALYALRNDLDASCSWPKNKRMRELAMQQMKRLLEKYPTGYADFQEHPIVDIAI